MFEIDFISTFCGMVGMQCMALSYVLYIRVRTSSRLIMFCQIKVAFLNLFSERFTFNETNLIRTIALIAG